MSDHIEFKSNNYSAVLSDKEILNEMENGNIIIKQFREEFLGVNSYDVTLGENFYIPRHTIAETFPGLFVDPISAKDINEYWELKTNLKNYYIYPNTLILGHTNEFIGTKPGSRLTTMIKAKSTSARVGLSVCKCASMGNQGYFNRYTLELENHLNIPLKLQPGLVIAQIIFLRTGLSQKIYDSQYQTKGQSIEELQLCWTPNQMLPKPLSLLKDSFSNLKDMSIKDNVLQDENQAES